MKIDNFRPTGYKPRGGKSGIHYAEVDITTGALFWKKTVSRGLFRIANDSLWYFLDTGQLAPWKVRELELAFCAKRLEED